MLPPVTDATFQEKVMDSYLPVLVKFSAPWCQPCKAVSESLRDLIPELGNYVRFVELDIESSPVSTLTYNVRSLPTLILFKHGDPVAVQPGNTPKPKLRKWIIDQLGL